MLSERDIKILEQDHCTREEAIEHLNKGSMVWERVSDMAELFGVDPEEIVAGTAEDLSAVEYEGKVYGISYVL